MQLINLFLFCLICILQTNFLDEEFPFFTPYDYFVNKKEEEKLDANFMDYGIDDVQASSQSTQKKSIENKFPDDISDEKLLTAAAQLVDVYNKRSKASIASALQKKLPSEAVRNRPAPSSSSSAVVVHTTKPLARPPFATPVPNFVVTKIIEKSPNITNKNNISLKLAKDLTDDNHAIRCKPQAIDHSKRMAELQRQKSLQIFNTYAPNAMKNLDGARKKLAQIKPTRFDGKNFHVKNLSMTKKSNNNTGTSSVRLISSASDTNKCIKKEPIILNFRANVHDSVAPQSDNRSTTAHGRSNANRAREIAPMSKNLMGERSVWSKEPDQYMANDFQPSCVTKPIRPLSMSVTKVYSRFSSGSASSRSMYRCRTMQRSRASLPRKYPSMSDLTKKIDDNSNEVCDAPASATLKRRKSCIVFGKKSNENLFNETLKESNEFAQLYELCYNVVSNSFKSPIVRRKRGRPKKKIYKSVTRDLLNTPEFSLKDDLRRIRTTEFADDITFNQNSRRRKRCTFLSIAPLLTDMIEMTAHRSREKSPISSFQTNRLPIKTYSRANLSTSRIIQPRLSTQSYKRNDTFNYAPSLTLSEDATISEPSSEPAPALKPQIQLLNIEPLSSTSSTQIDVDENLFEEVSQSTEYIIDTDFCTSEYDVTDGIYVEYLEENDEIESPAYEPISETITKSTPYITTGEADTTVETCSTTMLPQQRIGWERMRPKKSVNITHNFEATTSLNEKGSTQIEIKYLNTNESDAHSTTDSITEIFAVCDQDDQSEITVLAPISANQKADLSILPVRKSNRKRKIPSEFANFAKKFRN